MKEIRKEFPVLDKYTYLNTASSGLLSRSLVAWRHAHDLALMQDASIFRDLHRSYIRGIRTAVSRFFTAEENEIALLPNFSFGHNILLEGLARKTKVLLLERDYPSINWAVENRNFEIRMVKIDEQLELNIEAAVMEFQPDVFAFSIVQYLNGIKIDFDFLRQLKAYHPDLLLIADGTQYVGTERFSFRDSPIDILGASCYKWMLAGYGNGIFMIKAEVQHKIAPSAVGFNSADAVFGNRDEIRFMSRFEPGHQDTLAMGSIEQSICFMEKLGVDVIAAGVENLANRAKDRFAELGLLEDAVIKRSKHSSIFNINGDAKLFERLKKNNIICSQRANGIRISFHFYNTEAELEKLISLLK